MITPLKHRVLIQRDAVKKESEGGLAIPEEAQRKEVYGTVLALGEKADSDLKIGDRVFFGYHDGIEVKPEYCDNLDNCWLIADNQIKAIFHD